MEEQILRTYNDYVKYYLKNELDPRIPQVVCKLGLKDYAASKGIATPKTLATGADVKEVISKMLVKPPKFMLKCNNDSGGTVKIENMRANKDPQRLMKHVHEPYGIEKGEWFYGPILHRVFAEEYLEDNITDYKFHCHNGKVMFCQLIFDRNTGDTKECIVLPNRTFIEGYRLDENFKLSLDTALPENWDELVEAATVLAEDWKYVRVDLFSVKSKIYCGELTFAPRAGNYSGEGQEKLGSYFS